MSITINLDKAKEITKERLRQERKPLLEAEDIKFMQAQEAGSDTTAIVAEKKTGLETSLMQSIPALLQIN